MGFLMGHSAWQIDQFPTCWPINGLFVHWSRGWGVSSFSERLVLSAPLNFFCAGILKLALGAALDMVEGVVCGAVGAGCWGLWRGCWAGVSGVPWGWVLGAAEGAIGGVVGVPQGEGAGGRGGGVWWGGTGRRGGGCWGLRWARWRRSAGAVGVGAGGRGEGGGGGQRGAVGVGAGSRGEAGRVRQTASINTPDPPPLLSSIKLQDNLLSSKNWWSFT